MSDASEKLYDLFISYADADRAWVEGFLLDALSTAGVRYYCEAAFALGTPRDVEFENGIRRSNRTLLVLSPAYLAHDPELFIHSLGRTFGEETATWPVIPLKLEPVKLPTRLDVLTGLDATNPAERESVVARLCVELQRPAPIATVKPPCPYPGMIPFGVADSGRFFGREEEIEELVGRLRLHPFLAVIGPSGCGKSSLVFAGMVPALKKSGFFCDGRWLVRAFRPGETPLSALAGALRGPRSGEDNADCHDVVRAVAQVHAGEPGARYLLIVVDQFEEMFTVAREGVVAFQERLLGLSRVPNVFVVLTIRADFYGILMGSVLWSEVKAHRAEIPPLDEGGLRMAIHKPAEAVGVYVESALLERMVADAGKEPGMMPFVQETLVLLWERLERRFLALHAYESIVLPRIAYRAVGGSRGSTGLQVAMAMRADAALAALLQEQQALARRIFLRLVQFGEGRADTRRQQPEASLASTGAKPEVLEPTLQHLANHRLLTLAGEEKRGGRTVDMAHEALIGGWPALRQWVDEHRDAEQTRRRLEEKATEWARLGGGKGGLLDEAALQEAERWLAGPDAADLGQDETLPALVRASREAIRKRRRRQFALVSFVGMLLLAFSVSLWLYGTKVSAEKQRRVRNQDALESWVGRCEEALEDGNADAAEVAIKEIEQRLPDGMGETIQARLDRCQLDLTLLHDLDRIDTFRWTPLGRSFPSNDKVAAQWAEACRRFGIIPGRTSPQEVEQLVAGSRVSNRLRAALDLWLMFVPSAELRAILKVVDPDRYREGVRDAVMSGNDTEFAKRGGRAEALAQPAWFAGVLGQAPAIPEARRQEVLEVALLGRPGDLALLMSLGNSYQNEQRTSAENRVRWYQAAVAAHPRSLVAHHNLGSALASKEDLDGAIREYNAAIALDPKAALPHNNLGHTLKDKGDLDGAIREFNAAIALDPTLAPAHDGIGKALKDKRDLDGAIREFNAAITLDSKYAAAHNNLGNALYSKKDLDGAIREYNAAITLDPKSADAHNNLGSALYSKKDLDGAIREFNTAIALDPKYAAAHNNLGSALYSKKDLDGALREYNAAITLDPKYAAAHDGLGNTLKDKGNLDGAIREYNAAIALDPKFANAHNGLGNTLKDKGDLDGAIREFNAAIRLDPKDAVPHYNLGNARYFKGDLDGAIGEFNAAIALDPTLASAHDGLGNALKDKRDLDGAIREFSAAITLDPKSTNAHNNLGNALKDKGDLDGAIREYNAAIALDPKFANAHNGLGAALASKKDLDGAIREYNAAITLDPKNATFHNNLGNALKDKGNLDGAIREFNTAIALDPKYANAHHGLGAALYSKRDLDGAIREFNAAITLDPKYTDAHHDLGAALYSKKDLDGAIREFNAAIALDPKAANAHNSLGAALASKKDLDGAIREYNAAITLDPKNATFHNNLGNTWKQMGKLDKAITAYREAARLKNLWAPTYNDLALLLTMRGEPFAALQVLREGLRVYPRFIDDFRYNLACFACLVASGQGKDIPLEVDRPGLRREALEWLIDELATLRKLAADRRNAPIIHRTVLHWLADPDLGSVRDVGKLPPAERETWALLWAVVRNLRDDTAPREVAPPPRLLETVAKKEFGPAIADKTKSATDETDSADRRK